jgi:hypothetical protein
LPRGRAAAQAAGPELCGAPNRDTADGMGHIDSVKDSLLSLCTSNLVPQTGLPSACKDVHAAQDHALGTWQRSRPVHECNIRSTT